MYTTELNHLLSKLNPEQLQVASQNGGLFSILGGPGSGKTATLVARMARMIQEGLHPNYILAMTFTKSAAEELENRLASLGAHGASVGTIHSFCYQLLREELHLELKVDAFETLDTDLKKIARAYGRSQGIAYKEIYIPSVYAFVSHCKANGLAYVAEDPFNLNKWTETPMMEYASLYSESGFDPHHLVAIYKIFETRRHERKLIGFDDMILWAWSILVSSSFARRRWREKYSAVMVDECFTGETPITLTGGRQAPIKHLVETQFEGDVACFDFETGRIVYSPIVKWFRVPKKDILYSIQTTFGGDLTTARSGSPEDFTAGYRRMTCNETQEIWTPDGWKQAGDIQVGDKVFLDPCPSAHEVMKQAIPMMRCVEGAVVGKHVYTEHVEWLYDIEVKNHHCFFADGILVKNCQDSTPLQWDISRLLVGLPSIVTPTQKLPEAPLGDEGQHNLMAIGDCLQAIYGFRHARPENFASFTELPEVTTLTLPRNYRSTIQICKTASALAKTAGKWNLLGDLVPERQSVGEKSVIIRRYSSVVEQAEYVISQCIVKQVKHGAGCCTVLARLNASLHPLELECLKRGVAYSRWGKGNLFDDAAVQGLLSYLRVAAGFDPENEHVINIINKPFRFISANYLKKIKEALSAGKDIEHAFLCDPDKINYGQAGSLSKLAELIQFLKGIIAENAKPDECLEHIISRTGYVDNYRIEGKLASDDSLSGTICVLTDLAKNWKTVSEFLTFIDGMRVNLKQASAKNGLKKKEGSDDVLILSSIHKYKGRENQFVFLVDVDGGLFPCAHSEDADEELRLLYVSITRAKDELHISGMGYDSEYMDKVLQIVQEIDQDRKKGQIRDAVEGQTRTRLREVETTESAENEVPRLVGPDARFSQLELD